MIEQVERCQIVQDELGNLAEETTELGILAEEIFKNAAAAVHERDHHAAWSALESQRVCAQTYLGIHQKSLVLLARNGLTGDDMRRVVELQQIAAEFARIGDNGRLIAEQALALGGAAEPELLRAGGDVPALFMQIVRQAYIEVRGSVIASTTRDTALARRLAAEDSELDRLFLSFKSAINQAIAANPRSAFSLHRLLLIGVYLEDIGNRVASVCRTLLYTPPAAF